MGRIGIIVLYRWFLNYEFLELVKCLRQFCWSKFIHIYYGLWSSTLARFNTGVFLCDLSCFMMNLSYYIFKRKSFVQVAFTQWICICIVRTELLGCFRMRLLVHEEM